MKRSFSIVLPITVLALSALSIQAADSPFTVSFDSVTPYLQDKDTVIFDGMRVDGFGFNGSRDALKLEYNFDYSTLNFVLNKNNVRVYSNIGVFHEGHMTKDVAVAQPTFSVGGTSFSMGGNTYDVNVTNGDAAVISMNLEPGHVISYYISAPSASYETEFSGPGERVGFNGVAGSNVISGAYPVLVGGNYSLRIAPTNSSALSFKLRLYNANNQGIRDLVNNNTVSVGLENNIRDYAKFRIRLAAGQVFNLTQPVNSNIRFKLIDGLGRLQASTTGLALVYPAVATGDYYLFIDNAAGHGGSYSGSVRIDGTAGAALQALSIAEPLRRDAGVNLGR